MHLELRSKAYNGTISPGATEEQIQEDLVRLAAELPPRLQGVLDTQNPELLVRRDGSVY